MSLEVPQKPEAPKAASESEEKSLEELEKDLSPEAIEQIMAKVFDINNFEGEISVHNTTAAGLEYFLTNESYFHPGTRLGLGDSWRVGLDGGFNLPPHSKFDYTGEKPEFNLDKALNYQELIFSGNQNNVKLNQKKIVSDEELKYLKMHPIVAGNDIRNQDLNSMRILKSVHEILTRPGWTLYSANIGIISEHFGSYRTKEGRGEDQIYFGSGEAGKFAYNIKGIVAYDNRKINIRIISQILMKAYQEDLSEIIPVYSRKGDVLWPKQMSYEEVKKFVEERDKEKGGDDGVV